MAFILLYIIATFGCQVIQGFDLCKLDDLLDKKDVLNNSITKYGTSVQTLKSTGLKFCRVDLLQELYTLWYNDYDVTIVTYLLANKKMVGTQE